ncbi:uncharacterized protein CLUP02_13124 [Colletotrichum lupini]|uniref:Uncharacterized protein n=1 Tax=Colletotrichum lupini TaxID=145971 RepID=A0A9Q8WLF2_9PEZI|nr:uncharacterized protein CLUP02_13124 [Colletotrichum lupini]UQC87606.1 hypothetical protein CLUP02_13124 [Colletotrichum lupini]
MAPKGCHMIMKVLGTYLELVKRAYTCMTPLFDPFSFDYHYDKERISLSVDPPSHPGSGFTTNSYTDMRILLALLVCADLRTLTLSDEDYPTALTTLVQALAIVRSMEPWASQQAREIMGIVRKGTCKAQQEARRHNVQDGGVCVSALGLDLSAAFGDILAIPSKVHTCHEIWMWLMLPTLRLWHSIDAHYTDNGSRRLGGVSRDMDVVNAAHIEWARFFLDDMIMVADIRKVKQSNEYVAPPWVPAKSLPLRRRKKRAIGVAPILSTRRGAPLLPQPSSPNPRRPSSWKHAILGAVDNQLREARHGVKPYIQGPLLCYRAMLYHEQMQGLRLVPTVNSRPHVSSVQLDGKFHSGTDSKVFGNPPTPIPDTEDGGNCLPDRATGSSPQYPIGWTSRRQLLLNYVFDNVAAIMFHPNYLGPQDCLVRTSTSMEAWQGPPQDACSTHSEGTLDFRSYISSTNDSRGWAYALPLPSIDSPQWDPSQREMLAPLHLHNRRLEEYGHDFSRPRVLSMPEYETHIHHDGYGQPERRPQIITGLGRHRSDPRLSSEAIFDQPTSRYYKPSSDVNVDNVSQMSDLSPRPLMEYESNTGRGAVNLYPRPSPTRHRHRSHSVAEAPRSPPRDRKYLFVNRTVKDGKLISRGTSCQGYDRGDLEFERPLGKDAWNGTVIFGFDGRIRSRSTEDSDIFIAFL